MRIVEKFLIFLTCIILPATITAWIVDLTVLNANAVIVSGQREGVFVKLAEGLPGELAKGDQQTEQILKGLITPQYVETKLGDFLLGVEDFHRSRDKPTPTLDFSDLFNQAKSHGAKIPEGQAPASIPYVAARDSGWPANLFIFTGLIKLWGALLSLLLIGFLWLNHGRAKAVAKGLVFSGVIMAVPFVLLHVLPSLALGQIKQSPSGTVLEPLGLLLQAAFRQAANLSVIAGAALATLAVGLFIGHWLIGLKGGRGKHGAGGRPIEKFHPPDK